LDDGQVTWKRVTWHFPGAGEGGERQEAHLQKTIGTTTMTMMTIPLQTK